MTDPTLGETPPPDPPPPSIPEPYPVRLECERQETYNRFLPLIKWLLVLPHVIVLVLLLIALFFAMVFAFFATIITGRFPRGVHDFAVGVLRWNWRVYAYPLLLTDRYPPFSLEPEDYPARFEIPYPEHGIDRWRPLVQWLLILPYAIVAGLLEYVAFAVALIGVFVILFTAKLPEGMFKLILIPFRWQWRALAYGAFLVDRYPPFEWDE